MWQAESQSGTGSIPVVLVLLYFIICYKLQFLWHIVTQHSIIVLQLYKEKMRVRLPLLCQWCMVHRRSAKLLRSNLVQLYKTAVRVIRYTNVVWGSIPYCSIMRYQLLIVRNNKMRQSQLAVQSNGKRGFDSYYCYKIREKQMIILLFIIMLFISPSIALLILLLAINPVLVLVWLLAWLAIKLK